jgi:hypothetical protein
MSSDSEDQQYSEYSDDHEYSEDNNICDCGKKIYNFSNICETCCFEYYRNCSECGIINLKEKIVERLCPECFPKYSSVCASGHRSLLCGTCKKTTCGCSYCSFHYCVSCTCYLYCNYCKEEYEFHNDVFCNSYRKARLYLRIISQSENIKLQNIEGSDKQIVEFFKDYPGLHKQFGTILIKYCFEF